MHDLLHDPLIGARTIKGEQRMNLPELLAGLSAGQVEGYTGLRAHQADPWHVFLVQLAASIQARHHTETLPTDPTYWRDGLLDLADGKAQAWQFLVDDVTQPAFMQHPWTSWEAEASDYGVTTKRGQTSYAPKATTPDELDVLITSKNHDVKMARVGAEETEAWLYALVMRQTMSGYLGRHYGIVRMNSGFASRPIAGWVGSLHPSQRFAYEVAWLTKLRGSTQATYGYAQRGVVLTWLHPWHRNDHQYYLSDLEPWFIEAARPIRLVRSPSGHLIALGTTSKVRQIGPDTLDNGDVGDPWIPINTGKDNKGRSALTLAADGFTPQRLTDLLFEQGYELTALQKPQVGDGPGWFVASYLVRGQGTTDGFHQAIVPVPPKARLMLLKPADRQTLGHLAQQLLSDAKDIQKALNTALTVLSEGGPEKADFERVESWLKAAKRDFVRRWDELYFPSLWRGAVEDHDTVRREWQQRLVDEAHTLLSDAIQRLPLPTNRTWRSITRAERKFGDLLDKHNLPQPRRAQVQPLETMEDATP